MTKTFTLAQLKSVNACSQQVQLFQQLFGNSVEISPELSEAHASRFDFDFAASRFLSAPAWAEYERVRVSARAEYERVSAPAWAEYERVSAPARAEYERVRVSAWAEYQRVSAPAWAEYQRVRARTFGALYAAKANEHMALHPDEGVVAVNDGVIFLAKLSDKGRGK